MENIGVEAMTTSFTMPTFCLCLAQMFGDDGRYCLMTAVAQRLARAVLESSVRFSTGTGECIHSFFF